MPFILFLPARPPTAEDVYARKLAATLDASVISIEGCVAQPDETAYGAARRAWDSLAPDARPLIAIGALPAFAPLAPLFAARGCVALVHHLLAPAMGEPTPDEARRAALEREALSAVPRAIVSSAAVGEAIRASGVLSAECISVVVPPAPPAGRARGSSGTAPSLITGSAFTSPDAHAVLLAALAQLCDLDWRLCIIADTAASPKRSAELRETIRRFALAERVTIASSRDQARCEELWLAADLFAATGAVPGYDMRVAAALKRGLPVALCCGPGAVPAVPPDAGAHAPPGDHAKLGKALRRMLFDRDLRREMAEAAYRAGEALPEAASVARALLRALG